MFGLGTTMFGLGTTGRIARERSRWEDVDVFLAEQSEAEEYDEVLRQALLRLDPADSVVEVGCGCGLVALPLARRVRNLRGYDLARPMLEHARREAARAGLTNVELLEGDGYRLDEPDGCFDAAICVYLLDVVKSPTRLLREAHRLLRPGGKLISVTDVFIDEPRWRRHVRQLRGSLRGLRRGRMEATRPSPEQLRKWHEKAGFTVQESERWRVHDRLWNEFLFCLRSEPSAATHGGREVGRVR